MKMRLKLKTFPSAAAGFLAVLAGSLLAVYGIVLHILSPETLAVSLRSFSNIWIAAGACILLSGIYRLRTSRSLWKKVPARLRMAAVLASVAAVPVIIFCLILICTPDTEQNPDASCIFLLGGGIDKNGNLPAPVQKRADTAISCWKSLEKPAIIVVTGGAKEFKKFEEAPALKRRLESGGIPPECILTESKALDTIQNFENAAQLLCAAENRQLNEILQSNIVIVTNFFHLHRAQIIAKRLGFANISGCAAPDEKLYMLTNYTREICAYIKLALRIALTGRPRSMAQPYDGTEKQPASGSPECKG